MRIMYLSSAYLGYVHMYALEAHTGGDSDASVVAEQPAHGRQPELRAERPTLRKRGVAILQRLTSRCVGYSEERSC